MHNVFDKSELERLREKLERQYKRKDADFKMASRGFNVVFWAVAVDLAMAIYGQEGLTCAVTYMLILIAGFPLIGLISRREGQRVDSKVIISLILATQSLYVYGFSGEIVLALGIILVNALYFLQKKSRYEAVYSAQWLHDISEEQSQKLKKASTKYDELISEFRYVEAQGRPLVKIELEYLNEKLLKLLANDLCEKIDVAINKGKRE
jgi:hypothetical protein